MYSVDSHHRPPSSTSSHWADAKLPEFSRLVNYPHHLARGRGDKSVPADGKKHCVMCGQLRLCSAAVARTHNNNGSPENKTLHIIPRQNKGVCTCCDVAVWSCLATDTDIKWCKGCKNFRPWAAFGDKGSATKCMRCRKRQKDKYARQKNTCTTGTG